MFELINLQKTTKKLDVKDYLTARNIKYSDITDIKLFVKHRQNIKDTQAVLCKDFDNGISFDGQYVFITFFVSDFSNDTTSKDKLHSNEKYVYGLGFEVTGHENLVEPKIVNIDGNMANFIVVLPNFVNNK